MSISTAAKVTEAYVPTAPCSDWTSKFDFGADGSCEKGRGWVDFGLIL